ncbi:MAG: TonB-dependent receptor [Bacteroidota bacterium]
MHPLRFHSSLVVMCLLLSSSLHAQEKKEPEHRDVTVPDQAAAPLPKIELPEFLITGQETIDLPVSSKSIFEEEKLYVPGSQGPGQKDAGVGEGAKQQIDFAEPAGQLNGRVVAGIGNYTSPLMEGWFGKNYDGGGVLFHANYASTSGQVTDANWQKTGIGIEGNYLSPESLGVLARSRLNGGLNFAGMTYRAYGSSDPSQVRTLNNLRFNLGLASRATGLGGLDEPLDYSARVSWNGTSLNDSLNSSENDVGILVSGSTRKNDIQLHGSLEYVASDVSMQLPPNFEMHSPQWFDLRLSGEKFFLPDLQATVTVQQFIYKGNLSVASGRFYPGAQLRYFMSDAATVYLSIAPTVDRNTLASLVTSDKYIRNVVELRPSEVPFAFTLGSEYTFSDKFYGNGSLSYSSIQNFPVFIELNSAKVWDVTYLPKVDVTRLTLEGSYTFSQENSATLSGSFNSTQAQDSSNTVPNIPMFTASGLYRRSFGSGVVAEVYAEYFSKRWKDFAHSGANAGYLDVGGKAEYQLLDNLRVVMELDNILDRQYFVWDGYVERPLFISLGITYKW